MEIMIIIQAKGDGGLNQGRNGAEATQAGNLDEF